MSFCSGSLTLFHNSDPHPISPQNNTALGLSLRAGGRGLIDPEEIPGWLFPCLLEWMCTLFWLMAIITGKEFSIKRLLPRLISDDVNGVVKENVTKKRQEFRFSPGECYFRAHALWICDNVKDSTSRSFMHFFFQVLAFYDNVIDANLVINRKVLLTWACANRRFDFWCWLSCCEVPSTQTQDNLWVMFPSALLLRELGFDCVKCDCFLDSWNMWSKYM